MNKSLFNEFQPVSSKAWKQKIQYDLKGADYNDTLIWQSREGISVKPFYHSEDFKSPPEGSIIPESSWKIGQSIVVEDASEANKIALNAIERGAESIVFTILSKETPLNDVLKNINLDAISVYIKMAFLSSNFVDQVLANRPTNSKFYFQSDIIHNLVKTGNWYTTLKEDHSEFETIVKTTNQLIIDTTLYQNAGATMVQQLAYAISHSNEYLNHFANNNPEWPLNKIEVTFKVAIGSNYFFEIAKLRALRQLWKVLASEFNANTSCNIIATPSHRNKTIYDYNINMLRTTTECMSAILGGADTIINQPYDDLYHHTNEFGERISRNQLLILKHESYFDAVQNPADGTYYIESLTTELAEKALAIFKSIEATGGFLKQLKEGKIQQKIKESASKEQADFDAGDLTLLGSNKHPNPKDLMKNDLEKSPFLKIHKRKTLLEPIIEIRLSEKLEINRLKNE